MKTGSPAVRDLLGIDLRALALLRMGLALLVFWDQLHALRNVQVFYSDAGILPRSALLTEFAHDSARYWSLHLLGGTVWSQVLFILVAMAAAVALFLGYRTRWALLITWGLTASLQARNPGVLYGADTVLRVLQFWCLFLPLGARWAVDAKLGTEVEQRWLSVGGLALLLQVTLIYWFTAALKHGPEWTRDYTAVYYALSADQFTQGLGHWVLRQPSLCAVLTAVVWWMELLCPFFIFLPWGRSWLRPLIILSMWGMHLGLACCMRIGYFPVVMMLCWLPFLPSGLLDKAEPWLRSRFQWLGQKLGLLRGIAPLSQWQSHPVSQGWLAVLLALVLWNNLSTLPDGVGFPYPLRRVLEAVRMDQHWALFAPSPIVDDGWLVLEAELYDGSVVDVLRGGKPPSGEKPQHLSAEYADWKWQKLHACLPFPDYQGIARRWGDYEVGRWSMPHDAGQRARSWRLWLIRETTLPDYQAPILKRFLITKNTQFVLPE